MAMYIETNSGSKYCWHVGETLGHINATDVSMIQVDGDELDKVREKFSYLVPNPCPRVIRWYGDNAKFIVGNLQMYR